jgi:hypothetical protein
MLSNNEANDLFRQLVAVNAEMDQHMAKARDVSERLTAAKATKTKLPQKELADMMAELLKNQQTSATARFGASACTNSLRARDSALRSSTSGRAK